MGITDIRLTDHVDPEEENHVDMSTSADTSRWPSGDGNMAACLRGDAASLPTLGPSGTWPGVLKVAVQTALDSPLPTVVWWGSDLLQFPNDAACQLLDAGGRDMDPGLPADTAYSDLEAWAELRPAVAGVMANGMSTTISPLHGHAAWACSTIVLSPVRSDNGAVAGVQGTCLPLAHNVDGSGSDPVRDFGLELSEALRGLTDPIEVQAVASRILGERLQADRAYYLEIDEESEHLVIDRHFVRSDAPSIVGRYPFSVFPWVVPTFRRGEPVVINDSWTTPLISDPERPAMDTIKVGAFIAIPLVKQGHLVAALCVTDVEPRVWTPQDVTLLQAAAERTWAAVEQARAEESLRRSEEKYRTLFNSIDEGFCIIEMIFDDDDKPQDYRFIEVNPAFELHTTIKNATGKTMKEIIPDHESDWFDIYGHIALTGEPLRFVNEAAGLGDMWFELNAFRIGDPAQRRVAVLFTDITERTRAEAALRASEALFRGFAEASADALWIVDAATGQLEYLSPAFERIWGEPRDRIMHDIGRWRELIHEDDRPHVDDNITHALAGETLVSEYRIVRPDGTLRWIRDTGFPIFSANGDVTRAAGIAQDVTEQKHAEEERESFVDAAAHDLKTPITSLRGQAQLLLRRARRDQSVGVDVLEPRLLEIEAATMRMVRVIEEMLDATHLRAARALDLHVAKMDLVQLAEQTVAEAQRATGRHTIHVDTGKPEVVGWWDSGRLGRVLGNLIGNAIKFSPEGGDIIVRIEETGGAKSGEAIVRVSDRGIGIPAGDLPHLFQRFQRAGNVKRIPGTGIGLAGARQIVEQHGGTLTVSSVEGQGSVFEMRLPRVPFAAIDGGRAG